MKVIVMNNSGNVGKSTLCQHLLMPRLQNPELIRVETLNEDGAATGDKIGADEFDIIFTSILGAENDVIVDVGSSNIEMFQNKLENDFAGSHVFIDYFIIPVIPTEKQQADTVNTINHLLIIGVDPEKIKVVFNRAVPKKLIRDQFSIFAETATGLPSKNYENYPIVNEVDLFKTLTRHKIKFDDVKNDTRDHVKLASEAKTSVARAKIQMAHFFRMGYDSYNANLEDAFKKLNLYPNEKEVVNE